MLNLCPCSASWRRCCSTSWRSQSQWRCPRPASPFYDMEDWKFLKKIAFHSGTKNHEEQIKNALYKVYNEPINEMVVHCTFLAAANSLSDLCTGNRIDRNGGILVDAHSGPTRTRINLISWSSIVSRWIPSHLWVWGVGGRKVTKTWREKNIINLWLACIDKGQPREESWFYVAEERNVWWNKVESGRQ